MSLPLIRMSFPAGAIPIFEDDLAMLLTSPRFASRIPLERRAAVKDSRIVFFGRRSGDASPLDVLVDPAGEHVIEDIARLYNIDPARVQVTPQSTLAYSFTARLHESARGSASFYNYLETLMGCYDVNAKERVGKERFHSEWEQQRSESELLFPVKMVGDAREVAHAYTQLPKYVFEFPGAFITSKYLILDP